MMDTTYWNRLKRTVVQLAWAWMALALTMEASAQWVADPAQNKPICIAPQNQSTPAIAALGSGAVAIAWDDLRRNGTFPDVLIQKVSVTGNTEWAANGTTVSGTAVAAFSPQMIPDGTGGVFCTWAGIQSAGLEIMVQRISSTGSAMWAANGISICAGNDQRGSPQLVSDGAGGAIITWQDRRSETFDIYAQRVNANGQVQWTSNGVVVCDAIGAQQSPKIVSDGSNGAVICWGDARTAVNETSVLDVFAQRVGSSGVRQWTPGGVLITPVEPANVYDMCSDGAGGAIIAWNFVGSSFPIPGSSPIYAQRIGIAGTLLWSPQVQVSLTPTAAAPTITEDGGGGAVLAWEQAASSISVRNISAQRLGPAGNAMWASGGVIVSSVEFVFQRSPEIIPAGGGASIVCWQDDRNGSTDMFAQKLSATGVGEWTTNGATVTSAAGVQQSHQLVSDGAGGAIFTWQDSRGADQDIYAARIEASGNQSAIEWEMIKAVGGNGIRQ